MMDINRVIELEPPNIANLVSLADRFAPIPLNSDRATLWLNLAAAELSRYARAEDLQIESIFQNGAGLNPALAATPAGQLFADFEAKFERLERWRAAGHKAQEVAPYAGAAALTLAVYVAVQYGTGRIKAETKAQIRRRLQRASARVSRLIPHQKVSPASVLRQLAFSGQLVKVVWQGGEKAENRGGFLQKVGKNRYEIVGEPDHPFAEDQVIRLEITRSDQGRVITLYIKER